MFKNFKLPWCCNDDNTPEVQAPQYLIMFSNQDAKTKKIEKKFAKHQEGVINEQLMEWKRMKYKSKVVRNLLKISRGNDGKFIDPDFSHCNQNISGQNQMEQSIVWMRVGEIFKGLVYSTPESLEFFDKFSFNQKTLKEALAFMQRTHIHKLKNFLTKELSETGLYQFKFYRNGIIENVIIDDFVPTYNKRPLFTGAVRDRQAYPMIIQKALAKVCGSYENIPTNVDELLQILFCGPLQKKRINDLNDKQVVEKAIRQTLFENGVAAFQSKKDGKIRNYGINEGQIYHIVNIHEVSVNQTNTILYQMTSEKKLSSWNGNFSFNDPKWDKIQSKSVNYIFNQLKTNKSFCMSEADLVHVFDHLVIFQGTQSHNKDWVENFSDTDYPSFSQFQLFQPSKIFLRLSANQELRTAMILVKQVKHNDFEFVKGAFHENAFSIEFSEKLQTGKYIICVFHDWILSKNGPYKIFLQSSTHTSLCRIPENYYPNFLQNLFFKHSKSMLSLNTLGERYNPQRFYSTCLLIHETGFAYLHVRMKDYKKKVMILKINEKVLFEDKWQLLEPYTGRRQIELLKGRNEEVMLIMKTTKQLSFQKVGFPSTAFSIEDT